jgi:hypothetical protein
MFNYVRVSDGPSRHPGPRGEVDLIAAVARGRDFRIDWQVGHRALSALKEANTMRKSAATILGVLSAGFLSFGFLSLGAGGTARADDGTSCTGNGSPSCEITACEAPAQAYCFDGDGGAAHCYCSILTPREQYCGATGDPGCGVTCSPWQTPVCIDGLSPTTNADGSTTMGIPGTCRCDG